MKAWLLMLLIALPCQAVRNPFLPLTDPCAHPFQGWALRGISQTPGKPALALVSTPGGWRRLQHGGEPLPGWQVADITDESVLMKTQGTCAPAWIKRPEK